MQNIGTSGIQEICDSSNYPFPVVATNKERGRIFHNLIITNSAAGQGFEP